MKHTARWIASAVLSATAACATQPAPSSPATPSVGAPPTAPTTTTPTTGTELATKLVGAWHEDLSQRTESRHVYVPTSVDLGPARFRPTVELAADGSAQILLLAANDGHGKAMGTWSVTGTTLLLSYAKDDGSPEKLAYAIVSVTADRLELAPAPAR